jgi:hypothetical protein
MIIAGLLSGLGSVAPTAAAASAGSPHVAIESVSAAPSPLPSGGGDITVTGHVEHATSCQLEVLSHQSFPVVYSHAPKSCTGGGYLAHVVIGANPGSVRRTVAFALVARNQSSSFIGRFYVALAGPPAPSVLSASASPAGLPPHGGQVTVTGKVEHARTCQLELLSKQSFPVVYASNVRPCTSNFMAHVTIGGNPSPVHRTVAFGLVARDGSSTFIGHFYVGLAAPSSSPPTTVPAAPPTTVPTAPSTTVPPTTTTVPPTTTTTVRATTTTTAPAPGTQLQQSTNWSGYVANGGPYTRASGTFTVPYLDSGAACDDNISEWVGIDGTSSSDTPLIQAGIGESMTNPSTGRCTAGTFYVWPWWEILPAASTLITTWNSGSTTSVSGGDKVTVTISQISGTNWSIQLTDNTIGETFTTEQSYNGSGSSAEWVVEAPTNSAECGSGVDGHGGCSLAPYSDPSGNQPGVSFSNLTLAPASVGTWDQVTMVQDDVAVSSPSSPNTSGATVTGFTVSYEGSSASARRGAGRLLSRSIMHAGDRVKALTTPIFN